MTTRSIEFFLDPNQSPRLELRVATITADNLHEPIILDVGMIGFDAVRGFVTEPVDLGTDHRLDRVTFHLPNLSDFYSQDHHVNLNADGKGSDDPVVPAVLQHDG